MKGIGSGIADLFRGVVNEVKNLMNEAIGAVNNIITALNSILSFKLPSFLGGAKIGVTIPTIPKLAEGGIVSSPTLAMIGEAGPEAVVPLSRGGMGGMNITINVAGSVVQEQDLAISVRDQIAILMRRRGLNPSILGV